MRVSCITPTLRALLNRDGTTRVPHVHESLDPPVPFLLACLCLLVRSHLQLLAKNAEASSAALKTSDANQAKLFKDTDANIACQCSHATSFPG